jgi:predicted site-specific integrase-resolvase
MTDLVSQSEAAELLGVNASVVAKFRANGRLAFVKLASGAIRIHRAHAVALAKILSAPRPTKATRITADAQELPASILRPIRKSQFAA